MATMFSGRDGRLLFTPCNEDGTSGTQEEFIKVRSWSLQADQSMLDITTLGNSVSKVTPGIVTYTGSAELLYYKYESGGATKNHAVTLLRELMKTTDPLTPSGNHVKFRLRLQDGTTNHDVEIKGYITSVGYGVSVGDIVSTQVNFTGSDFLQVVSL